MIRITSLFYYGFLDLVIIVNLQIYIQLYFCPISLFHKFIHTPQQLSSEVTTRYMYINTSTEKVNIWNFLQLLRDMITCYKDFSLPLFHPFQCISKLSLVKIPDKINAQHLRPRQDNTMESTSLVTRISLEILE